MVTVCGDFILERNYRGKDVSEFPEIKNPQCGVPPLSGEWRGSFELTYGSEG
jgi:hypothetical protein